MSYVQDDAKQNNELWKIFNDVKHKEKDGFDMELSLPMCNSGRREYHLGAIVHNRGECADRSVSVLVQDMRQIPWARCWRAYRAHDGMFHAVPAHPSTHVVCGNDDDTVWVLEKYETNWILRNIYDQLQKAGKDIAHFGGDEYPEGHLDSMLEWKPIMRPQKLADAMRWAKKKREDGLTVRIRNTKTFDIIMGDVL